MNKTAIWIGVAILVVILGGAAFVLSMRKGPQQVATTAPTPATTEAPVTPQGQSLKDLLTSGQTVECTFSDVSGNTNVSGTTYVGGGKVKSDFSTQSGSQTIKGHMLVDGQTSYMWMEGQTTGVKMSFSAPSPSASATTQQGLDVNKKLDYKCAPWSVTPAEFALPTGVKFTDLGAMTAPKVPAGSAGALGTSSKPKVDCSTCDNIPDSAAKAQCRQALGC